jgi:hypothetical protein
MPRLRYVGAPERCDKSLLALVNQPLGHPQMTYDLRRLGHKGLIGRGPHANTYVLIAQGIRAAVF